MAHPSENTVDDLPEIELEKPTESFEYKYGRLFEASPLPVIVTDLDNNLKYFNSAAQTLLGIISDNAISCNFDEIVRFENESLLREMNDLLNAGKNFRGECELISINAGERTHCEIFVTTVPEGFRLFYLNDLTERKQLEKQFLADEERRWQTQKNEALERLAGGIAHEFNNLLAVILLHTDMLNLQLPSDSLLLHRINEIKAVSNDAAGIVRQLLAFGRKQPMNPTPVVLNKIVIEFDKMLPARLGTEIQTEISLDPDLGVCFVDQNQITQAIMNLASNAKEAMPNGGSLRIETKNIEVTKDSAHIAQSSGMYIQISISDNGTGMNSSTLEHIFEPFFSTRESAKGAGLGLATVYGVVKQSSGFIWVESEVGVGTTFRIQFPRVDQPEPALETTWIQDDLLQSSNGTILLVDDDPSVRSIATEILRITGYEVLEAGSGMEAVAIAHSHNKTIHLLLSDYLMPKMNGIVTARKIREIYPDVSILLMSGNIEDVATSQYTSDIGFTYIGKPFSAEKLTQKVREVLGSK